MPRALWRRRNTVDNPRPAGRRWTGPLRRSGTLARRVLRVRVGRHGRDPAGHPVVVRSSGSYLSGPDRQVAGRPRFRVLNVPPVEPVTRVSPALPVAAPAAVPLLPGDHTALRRLAFVLVNGCTLASLLLGVGAIMLAMQGDVRTAAYCLIACVTFDGLDGALARRLGVASPFGAQMDSLADMCSFGVAAPVVVYASLVGSVSPAAAGLACALVAGCSAVRLARFNVSPNDGRFFCGVPTTMAAAVLALAVLIDPPVSGRVELAGVAVLAAAMVSSFPYVKLARLIMLPPWLWLVPVAGALIDVRLTFASAVLVYLASGPLLWLRQRRGGAAARGAPVS